MALDDGSIALGRVYGSRGNVYEAKESWLPEEANGSLGRLSSGVWTVLLDLVLWKAVGGTGRLVNADAYAWSAWRS